MYLKRCLKTIKYPNQYRLDNCGGRSVQNLPCFGLRCDSEILFNFSNFNFTSVS
eukprot:UN19557